MEIYYLTQKRLLLYVQISLVHTIYLRSFFEYIALNFIAQKMIK